MKICTKCGINKDESQFRLRGGNKKGRRNECRECGKVYLREYYRSNKEKYREYGRRQRRRISAAKVYFYKWLHTQHCFCCGTDDALVLEFHHRNPSKKRYEIGELVGKGYGVKTLISELARCDVLCANCHKHVHFEFDENGYRIMKELLVETKC